MRNSFRKFGGYVRWWRLSEAALKVQWCEAHDIKILLLTWYFPERRYHLRSYARIVL